VSPAGRNGLWYGRKQHIILSASTTSCDAALWTASSVNWFAGFDFEIKVIARIPDQA